MILLRILSMVNIYFIYFTEIFAELDEEELGGITFDCFIRIMDPNRKKENKD